MDLCRQLVGAESGSAPGATIGRNINSGTRRMSAGLVPRPKTQIRVSTVLSIRIQTQQVTVSQQQGGGITDSADIFPRSSIVNRVLPCSSVSVVDGYSNTLIGVSIGICDWITEFCEKIFDSFSAIANVIFRDIFKARFAPAARSGESLTGMMLTVVTPTAWKAGPAPC